MWPQRKYVTDPDQVGGPQRGSLIPQLRHPSLGLGMRRRFGVRGGVVLRLADWSQSEGSWHEGNDASGEGPTASDERNMPLNRRGGTLHRVSLRGHQGLEV